MYKKITSLTVALIVFFMKASFVLANDVNPIRKLRDQFKYNWDIVNSFGFVIAIFMLILTAYLLWMFLRMLWELVKFGIQIVTGKKPLSDKDFWIRLAIAGAIVIGFWTGLIFDILEMLFDGVDQVNLDGE